MKTGDKVEIISYNPAYYWKRELVGETGIVDEVSGNAVGVRLDDSRINIAPVWLGKDCVKVVESDASISSVA